MHNQFNSNHPGQRAPRSQSLLTPPQQQQLSPRHQAALTLQQLSQQQSSPPVGQQAHPQPSMQHHHQPGYHQSHQSPPNPNIYQRYLRNPAFSSTGIQFPQTPVTRMGPTHQHASAEGMHEQMTAQQANFSQIIRASAFLQEYQQQFMPLGPSPGVAQLTVRQLTSIRIQRPLHQQTTPVDTMSVAANNRKDQTVWKGALVWLQKQGMGVPGRQVQDTEREIPCEISIPNINGEPDLNGNVWPTKLFTQIFPARDFDNMGDSYKGDLIRANIILESCDALNLLTKVMEQGYAACVHFTKQGGESIMGGMKLLILVYIMGRFEGYIPSGQDAFASQLKRVLLEQRELESQRLGLSGGGDGISQGIVYPPPQLHQTRLFAQPWTPVFTDQSPRLGRPDRFQHLLQAAQNPSFQEANETFDSETK